MVVLGPLVAIVAVLVWQAAQTPEYTARAVLAPTDQEGGDLKSQLSSLSSLASIAGVKLGDKGTVSEFEKFQYLLFSDRLGLFQARTPRFLQLVFAKQWDSARRRWRKPDGLGQSIKDSLFPVFGIPPWLPPDGRNLAMLYDRKLSVRKLGDTQLLQLSYVDPDPVRAGYILRSVIHDANELLRRDAQRRSQMQATYLRHQLAISQVQEYRDNFVALLARQEQTLMLTNADLPYAAETLQAETAAREPTSQRPFLYAAIAGAIGLCVTVFAAIVLGVPKWRRAAIAADLEA